MEVKRYSTKQKAGEAAAQKLNQLLDAHSRMPTLFLLSGGSSLALLERITIFPPKLTVGVTDERFSENPKANNFAQLAETSFFQKAQESGAYFIDTRVQPGEDIQVFSKRFEDAIRAWKEEHPGGTVVITQGVGVDGHTFGIMPYPKDRQAFSELFEGKNWVVGYDAGSRNEHPLRATITIPFLQEVDFSVVYMAGKEKGQALSRMLVKEGTLWETPARIVREMKEVHVFTDIPT